MNTTFFGWLALAALALSFGGCQIGAGNGDENVAMEAIEGGNAGNAAMEDSACESQAMDASVVDPAQGAGALDAECMAAGGL